MSDLVFERVPGNWTGNDYKPYYDKDLKKRIDIHVSLTKVSLDYGKALAHIFVTHMNVDYDGAPNCYGPSHLNPLDSLANAGLYNTDGRGYYGLVAVHPVNRSSNVGPKAPASVKLYDGADVAAVTDKQGRVPIVQQSGATAGYFVSTTAKATGTDLFVQSAYRDSATKSFYALSYGLQELGVGDENLGIVLRHDNFKTATYPMLEGEGHGKTSGELKYALGECSYKVFLDVGGTPKTASQVYVNNNFPTTFIVFPGSKVSALPTISQADNAFDFAAFLALQSEVDKRKRGGSGIDAYEVYVARDREDRPTQFRQIVNALTPHGYSYTLHGRYRDDPRF